MPMLKKFLSSSFIVLSAMMIHAQQTQIIAHRGFWKTDGSAQNSITALTLAGKHQFYGSELDIHLTKDDVLVVFHDHEIDGKTIEKSNYDEIQNHQLKNGETIPTLRQYLEEGQKFPQLKLILEIKSHQEQNRENQAVQQILALVKELQLGQQVEYISFSANICDQLKKQQTDVIVSYLNGDLSPKDVHAKGWNGIDYHYKVFLNNPTWIKEANEMGLITNSWTINDEKIMDHLIRQNIQYISTDRPLILQSKLKMNL